MPALEFAVDTHKHNPLDLIEQIVEGNDWTFDRRSDQELAVQVPGTWCDYSLYFAWNDEIEAMHFTCAFDMRVPQERRTPVYELLARVNEKLWLGHFGMWDDEGLPMFRHVLPMRAANGPTMSQMEDIVETALYECERFYPAFQYVIWGGRTADDAVAAAMVDTVGEA
ncbi:MAG: YbjN domain-containing protein [Alphaproteobacteria bacterium]|jgi:hypothetical protein|nr:hypothetical protein [Magnetovibrio sp.]UTW52570.1 YbjN domain-containing protein [bacterium SCSIO 12827]HBT41861.1 hypothetical protein [Rhodospirillaceae bacterium]HCS68704.1 hypothetical protein [Rhodospirillaceae bacterium]|tara:strand:- start:951 stop:1454 length:504 start_codon:yes stop_codon:yes gene_type:complete